MMAETWGSLRRLLPSATTSVRVFSFCLLVLCCIAAPLLATPSKALASATSASDDFARANGSLGSNWTDMTDGGLAISSGIVVGTQVQNSGDIWTGTTFGSDQYSQIAVTSTQMTGDEWIGPVVRAQDGGQDLYVGIYFWNEGTPELMLFKLIGGSWTQLGSAYPSGPLAAGTQLELTVVGSTLTFTENGVVAVTANDNSLTGGAPGIMANGAATAGDWTGGDVVGTYSIGGTVSGLSGTVVLVNNSGDDLTVSTNGSFTFDTLAAAGASYYVTVSTNPSGQFCTVSNGSGIVVASNVTNVSVSCANESEGTTGSGFAADSFARPNGSLGPNWTDMTDGGLAISSGTVIGTSASGNSGDIWTGTSFASNQYSQIEVTSTQLTGTQWIGTAVRAQDDGQDLYVGIYFWNSGSPELMLFERSGASTWTQLGSSYPCGPLAAGTQLELTAVGSTLAFKENGVVEVSTSDTTLTGGAPGIMVYGAAAAADWAGGNAGFEVDYQYTDSTGIQYYDVISANNGYGAQALRVLTPTDPAPGVAHNFLFVLPVETGLGDTFGDGLQTLQALNAENQYNLTIIEPTFEMEPWYADSSIDPNLQYQTFLTTELLPWVKANFATTGTEQNWLIGFSKSGYGAQDLILKYPNLFTLAASWDFPADMSSYDEYTGSGENYGTAANFEANYQLTSAFVDSHEAPFLTENRIWIEGGSLYPTDVSDYDALLTSAGIKHTTAPSQDLTHAWDSTWVQEAVAALYQDSVGLPDNSATVTFNANGGSGTMATETDDAPTALTVNAFSDPGYSFSGWNTAANGSGTAYADGASYPFTASATLYAQWTALTSQTITFASLANQTLAQSPLTVSATASSGLTVSFTTTTPLVCSSGGTNGATITLLTAGTCTVVASQAGNATYSPATSVSHSFKVS